MLRAPLDRVVGVAAVPMLDPLERADRLDRGALEVGIALERPGGREAGQAPGTLRRDPLVEHGVPQVGARVEQRGLREALALGGFEPGPELQDEVRERVAARPAVDHVVRVVERVVEPGPERVARARPLAVRGLKDGPGGPKRWGASNAGAVPSVRPWGAGMVEIGIQSRDDKTMGRLGHDESKEISIPVRHLAC